MYTKQEYYDMLCVAAVDRTFPSINRITKTCLYRGRGKRRCAIGILIPDDKYVPVFDENATIKGPLLAAITKVKGFSRYTYSIVQKQHDLQATTSRWNPNKFLERINSLYCFKDVVKQERLV